MEKLKAIWHQILDSLWFLPGLLTIGGAVAAVLLMEYGDGWLGDVDAEELWWLFSGGPEGAQSVVEVIAGSLITVTGVIFSVTMIVLQLASSQFTPRVLRQFMADRSNQLVLGVFIGTFTYSLLVLRSIRTEAAGEEYVPQLAVTGAVALALISIGFLIYFINHIARSVQASYVIDLIARDTLNVIKHVYPDRIRPQPAPAPEDAAEQQTSRRDERHRNDFQILARDTGYLQGIDYDALKDVASEHDLRIAVEVEIGSFILDGQQTMSVSCVDRMQTEVENELREALILGPERTPHQDLKYGVLELMDIAVKAMSTSVNDPTTAVNSIHRLGEVLLEMSWRADGDRLLRADDGSILVKARRPYLADTVALAFDQIRHYAADNPSVAVVMLTTLGELSALAPGHVKQTFVEHLNAVHETARKRVSDPHDLERIEKAAAHALSRAAAPAATHRKTATAPG